MRIGGLPETGEFNHPTANAVYTHNGISPQNRAPGIGPELSPLRRGSKTISRTRGTRHVCRLSLSGPDCRGFSTPADCMSIGEVRGDPLMLGVRYFPALYCTGNTGLQTSFRAVLISYNRSSFSNLRTACCPSQIQSPSSVATGACHPWSRLSASDDTGLRQRTP